MYNEEHFNMLLVNIYAFYIGPDDFFMSFGLFFVPVYLQQFSWIDYTFR